METIMETSMEAFMEPFMEAFVPEMVKIVEEEELSSGKEGGPEAPGIRPIVLVGDIRGGVDLLRRHRVDLRR